jgi:hypothetical protein
MASRYCTSCNKQPSDSRRLADALVPTTLELNMFPGSLWGSSEARLTPPVASEKCWRSYSPPLLREKGKVAYAGEQPSFLPGNGSMLNSPRTLPLIKPNGTEMGEQEASQEDLTLLESLLCPTLDTHLSIQDIAQGKRNVSHTASASVLNEALSAVAGTGSTNEDKDQEQQIILKKMQWDVNDPPFKHQQPATKRTSFNAACA